MKTSKVIHFNLFCPDNSLFKQKANTPSEFQIITCTSPDNCKLLSRKECACHYGSFSRGVCPYGERIIKTGFTRRSKKYLSWNNEQKKKYDGIPFLKAPKQLGIVGDYVFLPYPHIDMMENFPLEKNNFIHKNEFNVDNIIRLMEFKPLAMFGGEIKSYQKDIPPLFLNHLSEQMPELFKSVIKKNSVCGKRYAELSSIGRKAVIQTLTPNVGKFIDIHGCLWVWDGIELSSVNSRMSFGICKFSKVSIVPLEKQEVEITDEKQVNKNTVFLD